MVVILPDPTTGVHPDGAISTAAASAAGFAPPTVRVMNALPYRAADGHEVFFELLLSTFPITYIGVDLGLGLGSMDYLN
ncbi:hypothetical protein Hte_005707 [Hypoxylon texense]